MGNKISWRVRQRFIIILSSAVLIITSFLVSKYQKPATQTLGPIVNWKTYTNSGLNLTFRYPPDLTVQEYSIKTIPNQPTVAIRLVKNKNSLDYPDIILTIAKSEKSIEEWIESQNYCPRTFNSCTPFISGPIPGSVQFVSINRHYSSIDTFLKQGNLIYDFVLGARNPDQPLDEEVRGIYNQILSTLRFDSGQ